MFAFIKKIKQRFIERKQLALQNKQYKQQLAVQKVARIKADIKLVQERAEKKAKLMNELRDKEHNEKNRTCPSCKSKNVNQRIKRQQGELKGESFGSGEGFGILTLNYSKSSSYGYINGKTDTNPVNKCNDCNHEWKPHKSEITWAGKIIINHVGWTVDMLNMYHDAYNCKFDPLDVKEEYESLEEKKTALLHKASADFRAKWPRELFEGITTDAFGYIVNKYSTQRQQVDYNMHYDEKVMLKLGFVKM